MTDRPFRLPRLAVAVLLLAGCAGAPSRPPATTATAQDSSTLGGHSGARPSVEGDRKATLLAINDVYRIEGLDDGAVGSPARLRTLRRELEKEAPDLLLLHAGDFLFPSFASRMYKGEQMIAALNALDGESTSFDKRMFVAFGNHEFERGKMTDAPMLKNRIQISQFQWLGGNLTFAQGDDGQPVIAAPNLSRTAMVESGGLKIGIFGLTIPTLGVAYVTDFAAPEATAKALTAELRARGAEVVVGLTHLDAETDRHLLETLGAEGPDLIVGGHDHEAMAFEVKGRWVLKADADARTASVVRLTKRANGELVVEHELRPLGGDHPAPDPDVQRLVDAWQKRHEQDFCAGAKAPADCLEEVYGRTRTELEAEENKIRGEETSLGDWVADRMVAAFASCGAQVAFLNAGSLRLNRDLPAGTTITRRHVEELIAYPTPLYLLKLDGATLRKVAEQSVRGWPGSGSWLQIGGFAYRHDETNRKGTNLTWLAGPRKGKPVEPGETVLAVTGDYLVNDEIGDQDGYTFLSKDQLDVDCVRNGLDLKDLIVQELKAAEPQGIAPKSEGRICQGKKGEKCLAGR